MLSNFDISLTSDDVDLVYHELDSRYSKTAIEFVYKSILIVPKLIDCKILPLEKRNVEDLFDMTSEDVALAVRIAGLNLYGLMANTIFRRWNLNSCKNINELISTMIRLGNDSAALSMVKLVRVVDFREWTSFKTVFSENEFDEVQAAEEILDTVFENTYLQDSIGIDLSSNLKYSSVLNGISKILKKLFPNQADDSLEE